VIEALAVRGQAEPATSNLNWHILNQLTLLAWSRLPNGLHLSCRRLARRRKSSGRQTVPARARTLRFAC